ncbi:hypothetical protein NKH18_23270 [Streptomyces sp. M10(2022)]
MLIGDERRLAGGDGQRDGLAVGQPGPGAVQRSGLAALHLGSRALLLLLRTGARRGVLVRVVLAFIAAASGQCERRDESGCESRAAAYEPVHVESP